MSTTDWSERERDIATARQIWARATREWVDNPEGPDFDTFVCDLFAQALSEATKGAQKESGVSGGSLNGPSRLGAS